MPSVVIEEQRPRNVKQLSAFLNALVMLTFTIAAFFPSSINLIGVVIAIGAAVAYDRIIWRYLYL